MLIQKLSSFQNPGLKKYIDDYVVKMHGEIYGNAIKGICDKVRGSYPKDFKFTGWHPQCICNAVAIQMTDEEYDQHEDGNLSGESINIKNSNSVNSVPDGFNNFVDKNSERIKGWKNTNWIMDNKKYLSLK